MLQLSSWQQKGVWNAGWLHQSGVEAPNQPCQRQKLCCASAVHEGYRDLFLACEQDTTKIYVQCCVLSSAVVWLRCLVVLLLLW